ncbi:MAG: CocE/NonD family hydrolase [Myxococcota bacterium]
MKLRLPYLTFVMALLAACDSDPNGATQDTASADSSADSSTDASGDVGADSTSGDALGDAVDTADAPELDALVGTEPATFTVRPGVEIATVFGATAGTPLTIYDASGKRLLTIVADSAGQAHFAYIPNVYGTYDLTQTVSGDVVKNGYTLRPGDDYVIRDDTATPPRASPPFHVMSVADHPDTALYEGQELHGVHYGIFGLGDGEDAADGFNYIEVRDGVKLGAMVRFPDPALWGDGPYPTVIEYSGYAPSDPAEPDPGSRIATLLGYASVGVNMRGSGCSGGVFDVFSPAQHADGYDVVETVARQPWVLNHKVGMVGLSYPGIAQLYVAYTNPPSLAAVAPQSVLADPWLELRPGGIYNDGFTRQWLGQRDAEAAPNGQSWTEKRIAAGDTVCAEHQKLRMQNLEFESFFRTLEFYPEEGRSRSLPDLVRDIQAPVFLTGAWQDEQTGAQFTDMLDHFDHAAVKRFTLFNGRHPDGFSPLVLTRWWEFLELYVAKRVPRMAPAIRTLGGEQFSSQFDSTGLGFEPDRFADFADDDYEGVRAAYEAEPDVRVLFESGGGTAQPGAPIGGFEKTFPSWPPPDEVSKDFYLDDGGALSETAPSTAGIDSYQHDEDAGAKTFFGPRGYELLVRLWDIDWTQFPEGKSLSYLTPPLGEDMVMAGPGWAELWISSDADDVDVQVTISEVRPDGEEALVQNGWLRVGHRVVDEDASTLNRVAYTFAEDDYAALGQDEVVHTKIEIPSVAHAFRKGSRLRLVIATPGRNHGTWEFDNPDYGDTPPSHYIHRGGATPSKIRLSLTDVTVPSEYPACPGLRGQPCRPYAATTNLEEE